MALKRIMVDLNLPVIFYPVQEFNLNNNKRVDIVLVLDTDLTIELFCQDLFDDFSFCCW
jgi:hypothetical protein